MKSIDFRILNESLQRMMGNVTKGILKSMYGVDFKFEVDLANIGAAMREEMEEQKISIKGENSQVRSYILATARTKFYLDAMMEFGKEHPTSIKRKEELDQAVLDFEQETGVTWPFKHEG